MIVLCLSVNPNVLDCGSIHSIVRKESIIYVQKGVTLVNDQVGHLKYQSGCLQSNANAKLHNVNTLETVVGDCKKSLGKIVLFNNTTIIMRNISKSCLIM